VSGDPRVHAVLVAYRPERDPLARALVSLAAQVKRVVVVDNGGQAALLREVAERAAPGACLVLEQTGNTGVAAALNRGIREAIAQGATHILLMDDDSVPAAGMVSQLLDALSAASASGERIAAAGPVFVDERSGKQSYFVRVGWLRFQRLHCAADPVLHCDLLINSGMLVSAEALAQVGDMDESLFIDHVDTEWCLRALSRGYRFLGVCGARMSHELGEGSVAVTASRSVHRHSPVRYRYIVRNSVLLYGRGYPSMKWKLADLLRLATLLAAVAILVAPRGTNLLAALSGLVDGLRGRSGPVPGNR